MMIIPLSSNTHPITNRIIKNAVMPNLITKSDNTFYLSAYRPNSGNAAKCDNYYAYND